MKEQDTKKEIILSDEDLKAMDKLGISLEGVNAQLEIFRNGVAKVCIEKAASISDGIFKLSKDEFAKNAELFVAIKDNLDIKQFIPASGAATRMFPFLIEFVRDFDVEKSTINSYINLKNDQQLKIFITGLEKFPFYNEVIRELRRVCPNYESLEDDNKIYLFIKALLSSAAFDFANKPKGVLPFHKYKHHIATPIEEHLKESAHYAHSKGMSNVHFTITAKHQKLFDAVVYKVKKRIEKETKIQINISYSYQKTSKNTLAVDANNNPFRDENLNIVFRPGGHGALIENLNDLDADIVFIKNIDNVVQEHLEEVSLYKKGLAGILLSLQKQVFGFVETLDSCTEKELEEIESFMQERLSIIVSTDYSTFTTKQKIDYLKTELQRPIRVCGMVKNEGEPGGGPFWVKESSGKVTLQIVELSQIDLQNPKQVEKLDGATHFNPVDIVCGLKNNRDEKYDLTKFIDHNSGFIVEKIHGGKRLKGYELPGLWNGAMANWITVFVEVPLITFNPVKIVNDLLKPAHQLHKT